MFSGTNRQLLTEQVGPEEFNWYSLQEFLDWVKKSHRIYITEKWTGSGWVVKCAHRIQGQGWLCPMIKLGQKAHNSKQVLTRCVSGSTVKTEVRVTTYTWPVSKFTHMQLAPSSLSFEGRTNGRRRSRLRMLKDDPSLFFQLPGNQKQVLLRSNTSAFGVKLCLSNNQAPLIC